jgi:hypothetical protein
VKGKIILVAWLMACTKIGAGATPPLDNFLLAALTDVDELNGLKTPLTLEGLNAWIEDAQVRIRTRSQNDVDYLNNSEESYALRIKPKAWGQREAEQKILDLRFQQQEASQQQALNKAFIQRYLILLDLLSQQHQTRHYVLAESLLKKEVQVNRLLFSSEEVSAEKLIDAEVALDEAKEMAKLSLRRLNALQSKLQFSLDTRESLLNSENLGWLITLPELQTMLSKKIKDQSSPAVQQAQLELELAQAEQQHVQSMQQLGINLIDLQFQDSKQDNMAFMLGINIPLGSESFKTIEKRYDVADRHRELLTKTDASTQTQTEQLQKIDWLLDEWNASQTQFKQTVIRLQKEAIKNNPALILMLEKIRLKQSKELSTLHQQALTLYINYLALSGQLVQQPLRNWIHTGNPELSPKL